MKIRTEPKLLQHTPTVTPVTPTATPAESEAPQGLVQTGTVTFTEGDPVAPIDKDTITLLDENGQPAASVEAKSPAGDVIGTYTVDKDTGVVTFHQQINLIQVMWFQLRFKVKIQTEHL